MDEPDAFGLKLPIETVVWVESAIEYTPIEVDLDRAIDLALENRSDVRQQEITLEQSRLLLRQRQSEGRPDLQFNASYTLFGNSVLGDLGYDDSWGKHFNAAFDPDNQSPFTNITLELTVPIFDWGRNRSRVEQQISMINEQERRISETEADLRVDVINSVAAVEGAMQQLEILEENLQIARMVYDISQQQYERGEMDLDQLLNIQADWMNTGFVWRAWVPVWLLNASWTYRPQ